MKRLELDKIKPSRNCPYLPTAADMRRIRKELGNEKAGEFFAKFIDAAFAKCDDCKAKRAGAPEDGRGG